MAIDEFYQNLFDSVFELYKNDLLCDVTLWATDSSTSSRRSISCHSIVLASIAPALKTYLADSEAGLEDGQKTVLLPEVEFSEVEKFIEDIYTGLCTSKDYDLNLTLDMARICALLVDGEEHVDDANEVDSEKRQLFFAGRDALVRDGSDVITYDESQLSDFFTMTDNNGKAKPRQARSQPVTSTPAARRKHAAAKRKANYSSLTEALYASKAAAGNRKSKQINSSGGGDDADETGEPAAKRALTDQLRVTLGPFRYNPNLSLIKATCGKMETFKSGFLRYSCVFRATTDSYYTTSRVIADKDNVIVVDGVPRQFRMKLPEKELVAVLAVGVRNGENIASTMACNLPTWIPQKSFANLFEMLKNICGISFGEILRHPRCSEGAQDKLSRDCIERFKDKFRKLSEEERAKIVIDQLKHLKKIDASVTKLEFHHLPQKPIPLEFNLVSDIKREEIMDYALLSGNSPKDLIIQSFFNFNYQKIPDSRIITILCDTISCFLGLGNTSPLHDYLLLKDAFDKYTSRTCQMLALQELGVQTENISREQIDSSLNLEPGIPGRGKRFAKGHTMSPADIKVENKRKFACLVDGCNRTFSKDSQRLLHEKKDHIEVDLSSIKVCPVCGKSFPTQKELTNHIYYHHSPRDCTECNMSFPGAYLFYLHRNLQHTEMLTCEICGKSVRGKQKLKVHKINKHMEDHEKPFVCSVCGKGYAHKTKLQSHQMNMHIRSRPFKCRLEGCEADFNELANRNAHERNVHKFDYRKTMKELDEQPAAPSTTTASVAQAAQVTSVVVSQL